MCLGIPMQIVEIEGFNARCSAKGVERDVSLFMLQDDQVEVGDYVMIHVGYAIQKMSEADARSSWELLDQIINESDIGTIQS
ncbi:MAG: HypC/HybG/HupF family hydrogenase formation chaperone [Gammaproteobacteria bacterium]|nr:HypC/HybG/HupF family hydrogenase formation chaperone [Gammaproteobacteria bacterium]